MAERRLIASPVDGGTTSLPALYDTYADRLYTYCYSLLSDPDLAADALSDCLVVAGERTSQLRKPERLRCWLYALARNECVRRRADAEEFAEVDEELTELAGRHRLGVVEITTLLGLPFDVVAGRVNAVLAADRDGVAPFLEAPAWVREQIVTAPDADEAGHRAAVAKRAGPYDEDGFPLPLDRRRISGRVLAWSTAAVVLIVLALLVVLPRIDGGARSPEGTGNAAAGEAVTSPLSSVGASTPPTPAAWPPPSPAVTLIAPTLPPPVPSSPSARPTPSNAPRKPSPSSASAEPPRVRIGAQNETAPACDETWTAGAWAFVHGDDVGRVVARWTGGGQERTVPMAGSGRRWQADLAGLPVNTVVTWSVTATTTDGTVARSGTETLSYDCEVSSTG